MKWKQCGVVRLSCFNFVSSLTSASICVGWGVVILTEKAAIAIQIILLDMIYYRSYLHCDLDSIRYCVVLD